MKITYDKTVDAMYIKFNENLAYKHSQKITDTILVDYTADGSIIGVEVLNASKSAALPKNASSVPIEFKQAVA